MRMERSVTSISWIPSEAVRGATRVPFELGVSRYDDPPPDAVGDLDALQGAGLEELSRRHRREER